MTEIDDETVQRAGMAYVADLEAVSEALGVDLDVAAGVIRELALHDRFLVTMEQLQLLP